MGGLPDERQQIKNNKTRRRFNPDQKRALDREDSAIRGREYVPDPEPVIINNYYRDY